MSKIQEEISKLRSKGWRLTSGSIVDKSTINDIKNYIEYLRNENERKDEQIKELVAENAKLEVKSR